MAVDAPLRNQLRQEWNHAVFWPLFFLLFLGVVSIVPLLWIYWQQEKRGVLRAKI